MHGATIRMLVLYLNLQFIHILYLGVPYDLQHKQVLFRYEP